MTSSPNSVVQRKDKFFSEHSALPIQTFFSVHDSIPQNLVNDPLYKVGLTDSGTPAVAIPLLSALISTRNTIRDTFTCIEGSNYFSPKQWDKAKAGEPSQGGGVMSVARGKIIEKAGVNMSVVWGDKFPATEGEHAGKPYVATGVSVICHPFNPNAPIAHMNIRVLKVGEKGQEKTWIGGGADLTPMVRFAEDTQLFHDAMRQACDKNRLGDYAKYREWCDEYFFLPHRGDTRGVGGIFFDYLPLESTQDFQLLLDVGQFFARSYGEILSRRVEMPYDEELKEQQLYWRGRYAEFNLIYDRGTRFGLMSGGNIEAIFASLPPVVKW